MVSSRQSEAGDSVAMSTVLELPPKLSCRSLVNLLSLYGTWPTMASGSFSRAFAFLLSAAMQRPSVYKLRLMLVSCDEGSERRFHSVRTTVEQVTSGSISTTRCTSPPRSVRSQISSLSSCPTSRYLLGRPG